MNLFLIIAAGAAIYMISLWLLPWWVCANCKGAEITSRGRAHRRCLRCAGEGRYPRLGVRILTPGRARKMLDGEKGRLY